MGNVLSLIWQRDGNKILDCNENTFLEYMKQLFIILNDCV